MTIGYRRALRCLLITFIICCALPLTSAPGYAAPRWEESSESGQEVDVPLPPIRPLRSHQRWRASPSGYDSERIRRFWRRYRPPRAEKPAKDNRAEEYLD